MENTWHKVGCKRCQGAGDVENIRQWKGSAETVYMARVNGEHITVM